MNSPRRALAEARLYAITPDAEPARVLALVAAALPGGVDVLQLRHKALARGELHQLAVDLRRLTAAAGVLLVVNDHLDIALLAGADGVHLGAEDIPVEAARRLAPPGFLVGASASTAGPAQAAQSEGADYIGAGPAFPTPVKASKPVIGPAGVAAVQAAVGIPVFGIGGVDAGSVGMLAAAGVRRACVMRGVFDAPDPARAVAEIREVLAG